MRQKVFLIPGTMCNEKLWSFFLPTLLKKLDDKHEFIHIKIPKNKNFTQLSSYLNDYLPDEKVILIGFSLGGYIVSHFATTFSQRVKKAFIIANSPCTLPLTEQEQRQDVIEFVNSYGYKGMSKARAAQLLDSQQLLDNHQGNDEQLTNLINITIEMDADLGAIEFQSQMSFTSKRVDLFDKLVASSVPFTFFYSERDALINIKWLKQLQQASDNCVMISAQGASHMLPFEKSKELAEHVYRWLNAH